VKVSPFGDVYFGIPGKAMSCFARGAFAAAEWFRLFVM
jgi:hypothetical protein